MSEQKWNFAQIAGASSALTGEVNTTESLLDEGKGSLAKLAAVWGGQGSEQYQAVQQRWQASTDKINTALAQLASAVQNSGDAMQSTEQGVSGMFA